MDFETLAIWLGVKHDRLKKRVPAFGSRRLEKQQERIWKGFEVEHVVDTPFLLDIGELAHSENREHEHDKKK